MSIKDVGFLKIILCQYVLLSYNCTMEYSVLKLWSCTNFSCFLCFFKLLIVCPSDENFALSMYIVHERHFSQRLFNLLMFYLLKFFIAKHHGEQVDWQYIHVKSIIITKEINISNNWFIWIYLHNEEVFNLYNNYNVQCISLLLCTETLKFLPI